MNENSENKEMKTSGLRPPSKIPSMGVSRLPSSSSIKLGESVFNVFTLDNITFIDEKRKYIRNFKFLKKISIGNKFI